MAIPNGPWEPNSFHAFEVAVPEPARHPEPRSGGQYVLAPTVSLALLVASLTIEGQDVLSIEACCANPDFMKISSKIRD